MAPTLTDQAEAINTRQDLCNFIERLRSDLNEHGDDWAHTKLDAYLESMGAWVKAIEQLEKNTGQDIQGLQKYALVGRILLAPKFYE